MIELCKTCTDLTPQGAVSKGVIAGLTRNPHKTILFIIRGLRVKPAMTKQTNRTCLFLIPLLFLIIGMSACRSQKKVTGVERDLETMFYTSCYPIETLFVPSCKLDIAYGNLSVSLNGSIYIRSDTICYFSGRWLLIEMRGVIYCDSFVMVNYLERVCYKGKNDYLQKITGFPVTPESLMMLFTADRCEETYRNKFNFITAPGSADKVLMQGANRSLLEMNISANDQTLENIILYNSQQQQPLFSTAYSGYHQYPQFVMPTVFDIAAHDNKTPIQIKANFQQILFNQPQKVNISVPSRYQVVVLE